MKPADLRRSFLHPSAAAPAVVTLAAGLIFAGVVVWPVHILRTSDQPMLAHVAQHAVRLLGILTFDARRAAAIVSIGGDAARVVQLGSAAGDAGRLAEVCASSIVRDRDGLQREIALPAAQNPVAFVR
ncbi:hypothetical protein [Burkholderia pseudomultivorans]|uniref:hypothetical protein n=1 Tax=Burkholderia pseudomultivorans TaxID=1207504 RepID=UPI0007C7F61B|nr:hypothetical protein [Burkholderia pseudomultivorans]